MNANVLKILSTRSQRSFSGSAISASANSRSIFVPKKQHFHVHKIGPIGPVLLALVLALFAGCDDRSNKSDLAATDRQNAEIRQRLESLDQQLRSVQARLNEQAAVNSNALSRIEFRFGVLTSLETNTYEALRLHMEDYYKLEENVAGLHSFARDIAKLEIERQLARVTAAQGPSQEGLDAITTEIKQLRDSIEMGSDQLRNSVDDVARAQREAEFNRTMENLSRPRPR